jgi:hypothetical protein
MDNYFQGVTEKIKKRGEFVEKLFEFCIQADH